MQVQATRGTLLIVMIYFRDSGNFVRNQGVPPQSVALDLKKKLTRNDILSVRLFEFHCQSQSLDLNKCSLCKKFSQSTVVVQSRST